MSEAATWYYVGSFGQLGPLTLEQMEELIDGGVIEKSTYVWKPSMNDWLPAGNVTELISAFRIVEPMASPPPLPGSQPVAPPAPSIARPPHPNVSYSSSPARMVTVQSYGGAHMLSLPKSDKNRTVAGVLQFVFPGAGRIYLGYAALGVLQLMVFIATCGLGYIWSLTDGVMILSGKVGIDGYGRALEE